MVKINRHLNVNLQVWRGNVFLFNIIILFFLSLLPIHVLAEEKVNNYPLGLKYEVFRDSTRGVTINEILSGKYNEEFIKSESKYPYFDYTNDAIWLKLEKEVIGEKFNEMTWLEYVDRLEVIDVYFVKSDYTYEVQKGGLYNLGEQKINFRSILFRFDPTDIEVIYIKLIGEELPVSVDTSLYSYEGLIESIKDYKFSSGFFYGFIGALAFYNLFLYFSLRERAYLYYIIYLIAFMLLQFLMNSLDVEYLSENLPVWFIVDAIDYASLLLCVTMVMFGQEFLETKKILPKLHLTLSIFSSLSLFTLLFFWVLPDSITNVIVPLLALIIPILLWISALRVMQMGNRMARLYLLGWTILLVSIILQALSYLDIIAFQAMYFDVIPQIAASIESLLLSLALADKINILKRQREEAQELYTEQLVKEDKMKDDFLFRTSHELKTPLHGIINISQALIEDDDNKKEQLEKKLKLIKSAGYRMSNMVNDILDLAKIKEGLLTIQLSKVDLYLTVSNLFEMFRYIADGKNIKLVNKIDKANRFVIADEDRLIQVFYNLLNNSLKNTNAGSVTISNDVKGGHMYISVEDTGIGIAPHLHEKIFHSYESISTNNDLGNGGLGLGLSISRQLVQLMGGSLDVDWSKEKEGTRFTFSLPISKIESKVYEEVSSIRLPALGATIEEQTSMYSNDMASPMSDRLDILIVDDEVLNVEILKDILVRENYNL
ncbi:sensor histidine kinase, partial [Bacillus solimangrovi]